MAEKKINFDTIKMLVLDVDGVLTDGGIIIDADGRESKKFNLLDGHGIRMWHRAGFCSVIISGRQAGATAARAKQMEIQHIYENCHEKLECFKKLLGDTKIKPEEIVYIGDDVLDIPVLRRVGFGVAVCNASDDTKEHADYITKKPGGSGAVREVIEYVLKTKGAWAELMERYLV